MERRNATVAVIGAGDFIGAAIARKFAAEGFTIFAGRRNGEKLAPLLHAIETTGGQAFGRSLDARKEDDITAFLEEAEREGPLELRRARRGKGRLAPGRSSRRSTDFGNNRSDLS